MFTSENLKQMADEFAFDACLLIPGNWAQDCPDGIATLVLLLKQYQGQCLPNRDDAFIHPYYFASQKAYQGAKSIVKRLQESGLNAVQDPNLKLISLCSRLSCFRLGKNGLLYYGEMGSRFHIQVIGLENKLQCDQSIYRLEYVVDVCKNCTRCQRACPSHAISSAGVDGSKCLREHMVSGRAAPLIYRSLMKNRLIGCDNCQAACPMNQKPIAPTSNNLVHLKHLLPPDKALMQILASEIGGNLAIPNRICAQACLIAGNSANPDYMEKLIQLSTHPSTAVAESAQWALKCINEAK